MNWLGFLRDGARLRNALALLATNYVAQAVRLIAVLALRIVLPPIAVGALSAIQVGASIYATVSAGLTYRAMRDLPHLTESEQRQRIARNIVSLTIEGVIVAVPFSVLAYFTLPAQVVGLPELGLVILFSIFFRLVAHLENYFSATTDFAHLNRMRLIRAFDGPTGVFFAWIFGSLTAYLIGLALVTAVTFLFAVRRLDWSWLSKTSEPVKLMETGGRYGTWSSLDKVLSAVAQQIDSLIVYFLIGPVSLAGYYLGVNIRGALLQVVVAAFWMKWSSAVRHFDKTGSDTYSSKRFVLLLGFGITLFYIVLVGVLATCTIWIIPQYVRYLPEVTIAAGVAIPFGVSQIIRSRQMLIGSVFILPVLNLLRIAVFGLSCATMMLLFSDHTLSAIAVAWAAFLASTTECLVYGTLNALALRTIALLVAPAGVCGVAAAIVAGMASFFSVV